MKPQPADWSRALTLLDEALGLKATQRAPWLAQTVLREPDVAPLLKRLLLAHGRVETHALLATLPKLQRPLSAAEPGVAGMQVGPFELIEPIGRGGMGSVWRARYADARMKRDVAIKLPALTHDTNSMAALRERFARERDFLGQLVHPRIARLYDAGISDTGQPYLAMEFVAGQPIDAHADARRLTIKARLTLFLQVLDAVGYAHQQLVLHRDLKAGNVLVDDMGQVRLLDFGVARLLPPTEEPTEVDPHTELTERAGVAFTLGHAAPEQVNHGALSTATDVYALGVMLYRLLTGLSPYQPPRDTRGALEEAVLLVTPDAPSSRSFTPAALQARQGTPASLHKSLRGDLDVILAKALKKNPQERYATVALLADDVRRHLAQQPISARADSRWHHARLFVARNRAAVVVSSLAALALIGTSGVATWQARISARNAALATKQAARANTAQMFFAGLLAKADPELNKNITAVDRQIVDQALATAERDFQDDPDTLALVFKQLADIYNNLGLVGKHLEVMKKRVALLQTMPHALVDDLVDAHVGLGYALSDSTLSAERAQALPSAIAAQKLAVDLRASTAIRVRSLCVIADLYLATSQFVDADRTAQQALLLAERSLPRGHPELMRAYDQRAATATRLGDFDAARASFRTAMQLDATNSARGPAAQLNSRANLANSEYLAGNYLGARLEALAALEFAHAHLGDVGDPLTALRLRATLAAERAGDIKGASHLAENLFVSDLASGDPIRTGRAHYAKAVVAMSRGDFPQAHQSFKQATQGLASSPAWQRNLAVQQASLRLKQGQTRQAEEELTDLVVQARLQNGIYSDEFANAAERLGVAYARTGRLQQALGLFEESCLWRRKILKDSHPNRVRCESYIALGAPGTTAAEKRLALSMQLAKLMRQREDQPALASSIRQASNWLVDNPSGNGRLASFPLLD